jgi:hypothetical protein
MRQVFEHRDDAKRRGSRLAAYIAEHFDQATIIRKLIAAVENSR